MAGKAISLTATDRRGRSPCVKAFVRVLIRHYKMDWVKGLKDKEVPADFHLWNCTPIVSHSVKVNEFCWFAGRLLRKLESLSFGITVRPC